MFHDVRDGFGRPVMIARAALSTVLLTTLASCASSGQRLLRDDTVIAKIREGESTTEDVRALLGSPQYIDFPDAGGGEKWTYVYQSVAIKPGTFIPVVGLFAGGSDVEIHTLVILFDDDDIVRKVGKGEMRGVSGTLAGTGQIEEKPVEPNPRRRKKTNPFLRD